MLVALLLLLVVSVAARLDALFFLAVALLVAAGLSRIWERYCLSRIEYRRWFSRHEAEFGDTVEVRIEIVNRKPLPLSWLEVEDEMSEALRPAHGWVHASYRPHRAVLASLIALRPYERVRRLYQFPCEIRGEHTFGPVSLRSGDLFGFATREEQRDLSESLVVYPRVLPVVTPDLPARHPLGDLRVRSWLFEDVTRIAGARDYRPGDGLRRIHWPATVRTQRLQSKVLESTTSHVIALLLNLVTDDDQGWGVRFDPEVVEMSIVATASLAAWALDRGYQVGLSTNGTHRMSWRNVGVPPARDPNQLHRLLLALGKLQPFALGRFDEMVRREARDLPFGSTIVAVTSGVGANLAAALMSLRARGHSITVVLTGRDAGVPRIPGVRLLTIRPPESWRTSDALVLQPAVLAGSRDPQPIVAEASR